MYERQHLANTRTLGCERPALQRAASADPRTTVQDGDCKQTQTTNVCNLPYKPGREGRAVSDSVPPGLEGGTDQVALGTVAGSPIQPRSCPRTPLETAITTSITSRNCNNNQQAAIWDFSANVQWHQTLPVLVAQDLLVPPLPFA